MIYIVLEVDKSYQEPLIFIRGSYDTMEKASDAQTSYRNLAKLNNKPNLIYPITAITI
ncbi:MAG: hypothetical protein ACO3UU_01400 [Minisyncoccia bacterium]|jgi:hypothetical protein